jgi:hypothetical protein
MSPPTPARRPWTVDEQKKLDDLMEAGKTAAEIATALQRTPPEAGPASSTSGLKAKGK